MKRKLAVLAAMTLCISSVPMTGSTVFAVDNISDSVSATSPNVSWLPTTLEEYESFIAEYGSVLVHDNHIVFCGEVNYSTGDSIFIQQRGTAVIEVVKSYNIEEPTSDDTPPPVGNSNYIVQVYQAVSAGTVDLTILRGREWYENAPKETLDFGRYEIAEDLMITEIDNTRYGIGVSTLPNKTEYAIGEELDLTGLRLNGSVTKFEDGEELQGCIIDEDYFDLIESGNDIRVDSSEFNNQKAGTYNIYVAFGNAKDSFKVTVVDGRMGYTKGDVNADGKFTVADVVMLQKWLLGVPDVTLFNWSAADLCEDGALDVFDLCMMKRALLYGGIVQSDTDLKTKFPEYYDQETFKGLEVYLWQENDGSYKCGLMIGTNRNKDDEEIIALTNNGATIEEMKEILSSYSINNDMIAIIPIRISEASYEIVDSDFESVRKMFWGDDSDESASIAGKIFAYEKEGAGGYCTLSFNENGRFLYYPGKLSSYMDGGDWKVDGDTVSLIGMENKTIYLKITDDTLVYIAESSDEFPYMDIKDGEKFVIYRPEISSDTFQLNSRYTEYGLGDSKIELDLIASELPELCYVEDVRLYDEDDNFIGMMSPAMDADIWSYLVDCHVTEECSKTYYTLTKILCGGKTYLDDVRSEITVNFKVAPAP